MLIIFSCVFLLILILCGMKKERMAIADDAASVAIKTLVRQAARWSTAARQDENSMIAVLHANYGAGYLWALKDIATESEIEKVAGINLKDFENEIVETQDLMTKKMAALCPKYAPKRTYLTRLGGEGS